VDMRLRTGLLRFAGILIRYGGELQMGGRDAIERFYPIGAGLCVAVINGSLLQ
jgi:hypothetical protein